MVTRTAGNAAIETDPFDRGLQELERTREVREVYGVLDRVTNAVEQRMPCMDCVPGCSACCSQQVLAGLALFLSVFIMAPVLSQVNDEGLQPYLDGQKNAAAAYESGVEPLREFMLDQTGDEELALLTNVARRDLPANRAEVPMSTLVPAFIISELKQAFIIGFIIFIPFLVIDIVVSGALMALGMMMMPPVMVSLPFKLLLFVLVDGWALIITSLVQSYA